MLAAKATICDFPDLGSCLAFPSHVFLGSQHVVKMRRLENKHRGKIREEDRRSLCRLHPAAAQLDIPDVDVWVSVRDSSITGSS